MNKEVVQQHTANNAADAPIYTSKFNIPCSLFDIQWVPCSIFNRFIIQMYSSFEQHCSFELFLYF